MDYKACISDYTWRTREEQITEICEHHGCKRDQLSIYVLPNELALMLRRPAPITMSSLGVLEDKQEAFVAIAKAIKKKAIFVICLDNLKFDSAQNIAGWITAWKKARRNGAAKKGGEIMAVRHKAEFLDGFSKIKDRWHLSSKDGGKNPDLLSEANTTRNTMVAYLGYTRLEWRDLSDAGRNRIIKRLYEKR